MAEESHDFWRTRIRELLKKIPPKVTQGGIQTTRAYLDCVKFANKYLAAPRATVLNLKQAEQKLRAYQD